MREIAAHSRIDRDRDLMRFKEILERAEAAMAADQRATALLLCREIQERFYRQASDSQRFFKIILDLHQYDDAERLMNDGLARHPRENFFIVGRARVAEERGDIEIALERWAVVRQRLPGLALGYARTAACLVKAGRMGEADAMLDRGITQSPDDVFCLIEHAKIAEAVGNFEEAVVRWQRLIDVPSDQHIFRQNGTIGLAQCLRKMGRLDQAEALLGPFIDRFGVKEVTLMELARIAEGRNDWVEAVTRWQRVKRSFPLLGEGYWGVISALKQSGRKDGVDAVLCELIDRFPDDLGAALEYAQSAREGGDTVESARRWAAVRERFPDCEAAYRNGADALAALGQADAAAAVRAEHKVRFAV
jgi:tetratricopeptide (TPR) repeat protein